MVNLLVLVKLSNIRSLNISGPKNVPILSIIQKLESRIFQRVDKHIIDVGRIAYLKAHKELLDFIDIICSQTVSWISWSFAIFWIRKECSWRALVKYGL